MTDAFPHLDYKPTMPRRLDHAIGIIGAGGIVNYAHLPAYKKAGFKVVADHLLRSGENTMARPVEPEMVMEQWSALRRSNILEPLART